MTYYNTTHVLGQQLHQYAHKAKSQEEQILRFFLAYPGKAWTPSEVWRHAFRQSSAIRATVPITSVRRAMTNLTLAGDLRKTDQQAEGEFGRPEYRWRLAQKWCQGDLFA